MFVIDMNIDSHTQLQQLKKQYIELLSYINKGLKEMRYEQLPALYQNEHSGVFKSAIDHTIEYLNGKFDQNNEHILALKEMQTRLAEIQALQVPTPQQHKNEIHEQVKQMHEASQQNQINRNVISEIANQIEQMANVLRSVEKKMQHVRTFTGKSFTGFIGDLNELKLAIENLKNNTFEIIDNDFDGMTNEATDAKATEFKAEYFSILEKLNNIKKALGMPITHATFNDKDNNNILPEESMNKETEEIKNDDPVDDNTLNSDLNDQDITQEEMQVDTSIIDTEDIDESSQKSKLIPKKVIIGMVGLGIFVVGVYYFNK